MVCDAHVLFELGSIEHIKKLIEDPANAKNMLTGPVIGDDGVWTQSHWQQTTPPGLWGVWAADPRLEGTEPFEIGMQGLGCFAMAKASWPGFHPLSRGFGGEEGYIHEKVRRAGGKVLCVPQLRWDHLFRDSAGWDKAGIPYPAHIEDHIFNLLVEHRELGIDAGEAIYQDFAKNIPIKRWDEMNKEASDKQEFGTITKPLNNQWILGVWYSDNTAPVQLLAASIKSVFIASDQCWGHGVTVVICTWQEPTQFMLSLKEANISLDVHLIVIQYKGEKVRSHATIVKQIKQSIESATYGYFPPDAICFLEHDVLYPENYFQKVGDAFATNPNVPVVSNLDYIGMNAQGFQPIKERHEPLHQLSMRWNFALENLERAAKESESGSALLEPQGDRYSWLRLPATTGLGLIPSVHVNHSSGRFTSHGEVCYGPALATYHKHWGDYKKFWPNKIEEIAQAITVKSNQSNIIGFLPEKDLIAMGAKPGGCCQEVAANPKKQFSHLVEWFEEAKKTPSDFHEHVETLRSLALGCQHVTQIGIWGKPSRVALAFAMRTNTKFIDYSPSKRPEWEELKRLCGDIFEGREWPTSGLEIDETDLLFIDTYHTADETYSLLTKHAPKVRKYLVIHTTSIFGEVGDNGGPGVLVGIRAFLTQNRQWTVIRNDENNYGLMIISKLDEDRKEPPGLFRKAINYAKAKAKHIAAGKPVATESQQKARMELCVMCPERSFDVCTKCGCPLSDKLAFATESCPIQRWGAV